MSDMHPSLREVLGKMVRKAWVAWAQTQPNPKPSWLLPWEQLSEVDKEADRWIGEEVWTSLNKVRSNIIFKKNREGLNPVEQELFDCLQELCFQPIDQAFPRSDKLTEEKVAYIEKKLAGK